MLQFQKVFWKHNGKTCSPLDSPNWGDSSEDEEREEEKEELHMLKLAPSGEGVDLEEPIGDAEEAEVEVVYDGDYPFDKELFDDEKDELEDDDLLS